MYKTSVFIFRRDLRLDDNTALLEALANSLTVIPLFIFTPAQVSNVNTFKSSNCIQFMIESLFDLDNQITKLSPKSRLWVDYNNEVTALANLFKVIPYDAIYVNADYTPYSIDRDNQINNFCKDTGIDFISRTDLLLIDDNEVLTNKGDAYRVYGLFLKKALTFKVRQPKKLTKYKSVSFAKPIKSYNKTSVSKMDQYLLDNDFYTINDKLAVIGGRSSALTIIKKFTNYNNYSTTNDYPKYPTTKLSAHMKFGTVSVREVYVAFKKDRSGDMHKKLYWRDFYYYIATHFDKFFTHEYLLKNVNTSKLWSNKKKHLIAWTRGQTGFPMVDAAMTQLNTTGFMHNRGRLVVSEFLVKDLRINWKYGEQYFNRMLVDIDRIQNTGNWNWSSSFGLDSTPFLRIFNPWTQSKKFDSDCTYIKKWLPELAPVPNSHIHQWNKYHRLYPNIKYHIPIVDHSKEQAITRDLFKKHIYGK